mmetsp:Transcript_28886/g.66773  ORF Transcript_28886/g.66773 Transcript_28886/m.66773 type:complete len:750 (+) Transcript_28886:687-2936(+)
MEGNHHKSEDETVDQRPLAESVRHHEHGLALLHRDVRGGRHPRNEHDQELHVRPPAREHRDEQGQGVHASLPHVADGRREGEVEQGRDVECLQAQVNLSDDAGADRGVGGEEHPDVDHEEEGHGEADAQRDLLGKEQRVWQVGLGLQRHGRDDGRGDSVVVVQEGLAHGSFLDRARARGGTRVLGVALSHNEDVDARQGQEAHTGCSHGSVGVRPVHPAVVDSDGGVARLSPGGRSHIHNLLACAKADRSSKHSVEESWDGRAKRVDEESEEGVNRVVKVRCDSTSQGDDLELGDGGVKEELGYIHIPDGASHTGRLHDLLSRQGLHRRLVQSHLHGGVQEAVFQAKYELAALKQETVLQCSSASRSVHKKRRIYVQVVQLRFGSQGIVSNRVQQVKHAPGVEAAEGERLQAKCQVAQVAQWNHHGVRPKVVDLQHAGVLGHNIHQLVQTEIALRPQHSVEHPVQVTNHGVTNERHRADRDRRGDARFHRLEIREDLRINIHEHLGQVGLHHLVQLSADDRVQLVLHDWRDHLSEGIENLGCGTGTWEGNCQLKRSIALRNLSRGSKTRLVLDQSEAHINTRFCHGDRHSPIAVLMWPECFLVTPVARALNFNSSDTERNLERRRESGFDIVNPDPVAGEVLDVELDGDLGDRRRVRNSDGQVLKPAQQIATRGRRSPGIGRQHYWGREADADRRSTAKHDEDAEREARGGNGLPSRASRGHENEAHENSKRSRRCGIGIFTNRGLFRR